MHSFTQRGFGTYPGRDSTPDPVFPLRRQRSIARRVPRNWRGDPAYDERVETNRSMPLAGAWPFEREIDLSDYAREPELDDDDDDHAQGVPRRSARSIAVRILGFLVLGAALFGCGRVLVDSRAIHEALSWATLGHADRILGTAQRTAHDDGP